MRPRHRGTPIDASPLGMVVENIDDQKGIKRRYATVTIDIVAGVVSHPMIEVIDDQCAVNWTNETITIHVTRELTECKNEWLLKPGSRPGHHHKKHRFPDDRIKGQLVDFSPESCRVGN